MKDMREKIKICSEILKAANSKDVIILSHADHDGFTATCLIDLIYSDVKNIRKFYPSKIQSYSLIFKKILSLNPKYFLIIDALVKPYQKFIEKIMKHGSIVINLDHHDLLSIRNENYLDLNPHNWGIEFINSSGLCWLISKEIDEKYFKERCWVAGIGAIQDYCIDDNKELMEELINKGYIKKMDLESTLESELLKLAKMINSAIHMFSANKIYQILFQAAKENNIEKLQKNDKLIKALKTYENKFDEVRKHIEKDEKIISINNKQMMLKFYNLRGNDISVISYLCEIEREKAVYIGYRNGLMVFRSLFYNYDVRELAKLFGGGGPHRRVAGAKTRKSFEEMVKEILNYLKKGKSQKTLSEFMYR